LLATFLRVRGDRRSVPPRLKFRIRLEGAKGDNIIVFALFGHLILKSELEKEIALGDFEPQLATFGVDQDTKKEFDFHMDFDENKRRVVETARNDGDVSFKIWVEWQYYRLGKSPEGSERVRSIASNGNWVRAVEGSETISVEQSRWNKVLSELGYDKRLLFELPIDFEEMLSSIPKHPKEGLIRRIAVASKSFQKALDKLRIGKWREAVVESRKVYEALRKGKLENGRRVEDAIEEMLVEYGLPKQNKSNITEIIKSF